MLYKNINRTTPGQTVTSIYYVEHYRDAKIKQVFDDYKFKGNLKNDRLFSLCNDICTYTIIENEDSRILFTHPPSTMFRRKEKDIDSMGYILKKTGRDLVYYFKGQNNYAFKSLFSVNPAYLKNKKAQHLDGSRKIRTKDLDKRYYVSFWNRFCLRQFFKSKRKNIICIIDDVSSTGGTLLACQNSLKDLIEKYSIEIIVFSLAH